MSDIFKQALEHEERLRKAMGFDIADALSKPRATDLLESQLDEQMRIQSLVDAATGGFSAPKSFAEETAARMYREVDEANCLAGLTNAVAPNAFGDVAQSIAASVRENDLRARYRHIDVVLATADFNAPRSVGMQAFQSFTEQISADIQSVKRPWETERLQRELAYALEGLTDTNGSLQERLGSLSLKSLAAIALEEVAGLSSASSLAKALALDSTRAGILGHDQYRQSRRLADLDMVSDLIRQVQAVDHFSARAYADAVSASMLADRMGQMTAPWLSVVDELQSATAFARLQAVGDVLAHASPFASAVGSLLRSGGLGDWRDSVSFAGFDFTTEGRTTLYVGQGMELRTTDPDPEIFVPSAAVAELFAGDDDWADTWALAAHDEEQLASLAFARLRKLERMLRTFIRSVMEQRLGAKWMQQRLPANMLEQLVDRQKKSEGGFDYDTDLMAYVDFTDYIRIIERKDNWTEVFAEVFGRKEDIKEALQRLHPLRLATMHSRSVCTLDLLLLLVESKRIANAIRPSRSGPANSRISH